MRFLWALVLALCLTAPCCAVDTAGETQPSPATVTDSAQTNEPGVDSNKGPSKTSSKKTTTKPTAAKTSATGKSAAETKPSAASKTATGTKSSSTAAKTSTASKTTAAKATTSKTTKTTSSGVKPLSLTPSSLVAKQRIRTEAELSGMTSETSDQLYGRLSLTRTTPRVKWYIRAGSGCSVSRTFTKKKTNESQIVSYNFDSQYRLDGKHSYRFVSAVVNIKNRKPHTSSQYDEAGYYMFTAGYGKTIFPGLDCEVALADITQEREIVEHRITPVYSLRMKTPLSDTMTLDSDTHLVQPWSQDSMVDSRVNLTYKLTSALSMRFTYVANNIMGSNLQKATDWDKSVRLALVFSR